MDRTNTGFCLRGLKGEQSEGENGYGVVVSSGRQLLSLTEAPNVFTEIS